MPVREQNKAPSKERDKGMSKAVALPVTNTPRESALVRGRAFLGDVRNEMRKVSSPSWAEVQSTTTVVILAVFAFAAFFYIVDSVLSYLLTLLLHALGGS